MSVESKNEVFANFKHCQTVFLATSADEKPYVRPVTLIYQDGSFWIATGSNDAKVKQIDRNPNIEFCLLLKAEKDSGSIRASGKAVEVVEQGERRKLFSDNDYIRQYWDDPQDPSFTLYKLEIDEIKYLRIGAMLEEKIAL